MADLSFKISDLETIPSYKIDDIEKIALENTYFLSYSHTIHGMNYVTKNYKIPLHLLREDLKAHLDSIIVDSKLIINTYDNIKELNINSDDFIIEESYSGNKLDINIKAASDLIQGGENITVIKTKSSDSNASSWKITANPIPAPYYISLLDKDVYNEEEKLYLDKVDKRSIYIIAKDNSNYPAIVLNFSEYYNAEDEDKDDAICSFKLYLNTVGCDRNITLSNERLKWVMGSNNSDHYSPSFYPGKIYSITFTSIPSRVFQGTSAEEGNINIIGQIDWFISY